MPRDGFPGVPRKRACQPGSGATPTPARMRRRPTGSRLRLTRPRRPDRLQPRRSGDAPRCGGRPRSARHRRRPQPLPVPAATLLRPPPRSREPSSGPNRPATRGRRVSRPPTRPRSQRRRSPRDVRTVPRCRLPDRSGRRGTGHRPRLRGRTLPTLVRRSTPARGGGRLPPRRGAAPTALYRRRRGRRCSPRRSVRVNGRSLSSACSTGQRRITAGSHRLDGAIVLNAAIVTLVFLALPGPLLLPLGIGWLLLALLVVALGSLMVSVVSWYYTRFEVHEERLILRTGPFRQRVREVPLSRLQAVDVVRPLYKQVVVLSELWAAGETTATSGCAISAGGRRNGCARPSWRPRPGCQSTSRKPRRCRCTSSGSHCSSARSRSAFRFWWLSPCSGR